LTAPHLQCWLLSRLNRTQDGIREECAVCCSLTTYVRPIAANSPSRFLHAARSRPRRAPRHNLQTHARAQEGWERASHGTGVGFSSRAGFWIPARPPPAPERAAAGAAADAAGKGGKRVLSRGARRLLGRAGEAGGGSGGEGGAIDISIVEPEVRSPCIPPGGDGRPRALCISFVWGEVQSAVLTRPALWAVIPGRACRH